jgi:CheY-like chemotaxis protein
VELPVTGGKLSPAPVNRTLGPSGTEAIPGAQVLVVEDEAALAAAVTDALKDAGYIVEHAPDGEQALLKVREHAFDAVVCDLKMPKLDGKAFYRTLSAIAPGLAKKVIFVTGDVAGTFCAGFIMAFAIGFRAVNSTRALRISATCCGPISPSASRRRRMARACSCDTRDSFTPISAPISFIVTSP